MSNETEERLHLIDKFFVRIVSMGEKYGRGDCLTHEQQDPLIEFYDSRFMDKFGPRGQFVSRYYCSTIMESDYPTGLSLDGGVPAWGLSADSMLQVKDFIHRSLSMPSA